MKTLLAPGTPAALAQMLCVARARGERVDPALLHPLAHGGSYAVQDATLAMIGPIGGWKVGARGPGQEPACAPLPAAGLLPDGVALRGPAWRLRGIEVEVAFVLGASLPPRGRPYERRDIEAALALVVPAIEVVESRLEDWLGAGSDAQLADLLSHGALVTGRPTPFAREWLHLGALEATLRFGRRTVAHTVGGHQSPDVGALLVWLANHCAARGAGLKAGQVVTTGTCTGLLFASAGTRVSAGIEGLGTLAAWF
ncbi:2-oxopent-4-enoate hydratase [Cupriavidus sp. SK-4]|uniref:2-keto-4-pentenoate hydratase n=1 Tax=Cupriavidus sp. SK-4 TaxID=574750 RepID=UPI000452E166|nr:fumarylacetoacetate hydrolase family protein [Cupriavidus sp. SK-4]EYS87124.1 2-oxopent-4-enoate hydratase [Cupriavidus sp. SK-4]